MHPESCSWPLSKPSSRFGREQARHSLLAQGHRAMLSVQGALHIGF